MQCKNTSLHSWMVNIPGSERGSDLIKIGLNSVVPLELFYHLPFCIAWVSSWTSASVNGKAVYWPFVYGTFSEILREKERNRAWKVADTQLIILLLQLKLRAVEWSCNSVALRFAKVMSSVYFIKQPSPRIWEPPLFKCYIESTITRR